MAEIEKVVSILRQQCLWEIHGFDEVGSTMTEARRLAEAGAPSLTVVLADRQTAGRGRYDRIWSSASGEGLWMTALVRPHILPEQAPWFTLGAAVAVAESLVAFGYPAGIKWPNDVLEQYYVDEHTYGQFLEEQGLDAGQYLNSATPLPLVYNRGSTVIYATGKSGNYERQVYTYQFLKNGVETAALRQPQEVAGYFFSQLKMLRRIYPVRWPLPEISS